MNIRHTGLAMLAALAVAGTLSAQVAIPWNSPANAVNLTSDGQAMDAGFTFELGVFEGVFTPTPENMDLWETNWSVAASTSYNTVNSRYAATHSATHNDPPFDAGKAAYVWGKRELNGRKEWILFRASNWQWPDTTFPGPGLSPWIADQATAVIGEIHSSGTPFLMKSAAVPPPVAWEQWQTTALVGESLDGPNDDPDEDGTPNLLEFVFDTDPQDAGAPVTTPVELQSGHAVITIPRRIDHQVQCTVEVSGNLVDWQSGPAHTETLQDDEAALVVRDLTPLSPANPKRFIRLRATLP